VRLMAISLGGSFLIYMRSHEVDALDHRYHDG
jgi:hypothetical protein